ncbi:MAG TPA: AI-2E family transporter, partial [Sphingomicrobium sp.]|nr:AI-2E family transporter [Sphingomicrobium sp.]
MDARTAKHGEIANERGEELNVLAEANAKRDRLLASLALIVGIAVAVALPFALRAGAEFFMPVTAALVIAIALVPALEWFERRGIPSKASAALCLVIFLLIA